MLPAVCTVSAPVLFFHLALFTVTRCSADRVPLSKNHAGNLALVETKAVVFMGHVPEFDSNTNNRSHEVPTGLVKTSVNKMVGSTNKSIKHIKHVVLSTPANLPIGSKLAVVNRSTRDISENKRFNQTVKHKAVPDDAMQIPSFTLSPFKIMVFVPLIIMIVVALFSNSCTCNVLAGHLTSIEHHIIAGSYGTLSNSTSRDVNKATDFPKKPIQSLQAPELPVPAEMRAWLAERRHTLAHARALARLGRSR